MQKPSAAEWLLGCFAGRTRAAAILGDLTELAATRGRLWFWTAYARTLFSLTWRILLALVAATIGRQILVNSLHIHIWHTLATWDTSGQFLLNSMGPLLFCIMETLWFVLPFAAVRYGVRDRFVQLTFAVAVGTTIAFFFIPFASLTCAIAALALAAVAAISPNWRKPLSVLLCTGAFGWLAQVAVNAVDTAIISCHPDWWTSHFFRHYGGMMIYRSSLLAVAFVCARIHGLLLVTSPAGRRPA